jgi:hypothetical protein
MLRQALAFVAPVTTLASPAYSLCNYSGVDNAKTTIEQEYRDSRWVVRARVLSAVDGVVEPGNPDAGLEWTSYQLAIVKVYKGHPGTRIKFFTERDSGGFYMDRPWVPLPRGHDIGGEYLLFLVPFADDGERPKASVGATFVNYSCGQSKSWSEVSGSSRRLLEHLAKRR